jgi:hypothetical protein
VASLLPSALRYGALLASFTASACGLKLDTGTGSATADPMQRTAQNRPDSGTRSSVPPEAALGPGRLRGFKLEGSAAYDIEDSSFLQCGYLEQWSVVFEGGAFERVQEQALSEECQLSGCLFVLAGTGDLSARGRFGQARTYPREISISQVTRLERVTRAANLLALNDLSCPD